MQPPKAGDPRKVQTFGIRNTIQPKHIPSTCKPTLMVLFQHHSQSQFDSCSGTGAAPQQPLGTDTAPQPLGTPAAPRLSGTNQAQIPWALFSAPQTIQCQEQTTGYPFFKEAPHFHPVVHYPCCHLKAFKNTW